eukprot:CAMPEP_0178399154 /NCGR_PEP_ID=MMETSP0689_2-20121128/15137_1 /TAXON_ID=160604 /ORGANISM="Amphidinium massartii, Strain CS-259" /LENGTH=112 /DNA_ID=CAMNT_0020019929 /DNA_START=1115 /DNA_END=1453 /DNA_ORIENTATION=+
MTKMKCIVGSTSGAPLLLLASSSSPPCRAEEDLVGRAMRCNNGEQKQYRHIVATSSSGLGCAFDSPLLQPEEGAAESVRRSAMHHRSRRELILSHHKLSLISTKTTMIVVTW